MAALLLLGACSSNNDASPTPTPTPSVSASQTPTSTSSPSTTSRPTTSSRPTAPSTTKPVAATTLVTLKVVGSGCRDCAFQAYTTVGGVTTKFGKAQGQLWSYPLTWKVPTSATRGMAFGFTDLSDDRTNGKPTVVVMSYAGVAPGTTLTPAQAQTKTSGSYCWVGTKKSAITLTVRVELPTIPGATPSTNGSIPTSRLVYTSPTAGAAGNFTSTYYGGLGVTGTPKCP